MQDVVCLFKCVLVSEYMSGVFEFEFVYLHNVLSHTTKKNIKSHRVKKRKGHTCGNICEGRERKMERGASGEQSGLILL